jgi:hypothetical protein
MRIFTAPIFIILLLAATLLSACDKKDPNGLKNGGEDANSTNTSTNSPGAKMTDAATGIDSAAFDAFIKSLAEPGSSNCGTVAAGASRNTVDQCVSIRFTSADPFYVRYNLQGVDSSLAQAIVYNPSGTSYFLTFDSDPSGGGASNNGTIEQTSCTDVVLNPVYDRTSGLPLMCP